MIASVRRGLWFAGWPARSVLLLLIGAYRVTLGQLLGGSCRFHPSCSAYAAMAIKQTGAVRGSALAIWRLLRCTPLSRGGVDYPPARRSAYESVIPAKGWDSAGQGVAG